MNAYLDPSLFERRFQRAVREPDSMPCSYPDWEDSANWAQFTGNTKNIPDGEIVLVFREGAAGAYAFRKYAASRDCFVRQKGGVLNSESCDEIYRYTGWNSHETDICCPNLEGIL